MKNQVQPATLCPLCGGPNACAVAAAATSAGAGRAPCWCTACTIDPAVLDRLARRGCAGTCICARCAGAAVPALADPRRDRALPDAAP